MEDNTLWWCDRCHASGLADIDQHGSVYDAIAYIQSAHEAHEVADVKDCKFDVSKIRVERLDRQDAQKVSA
jgi:hypothetical protein